MTEREEWPALRKRAVEGKEKSSQRRSLRAPRSDFGFGVEGRRTEREEDEERQAHKEDVKEQDRRFSFLCLVEVVVTRRIRRMGEEDLGLVELEQRLRV
jgi:hypothetical protein